MMPLKTHDEGQVWRVTIKRDGFCGHDTQINANTVIIRNGKYGTVVYIPAPRSMTQGEWVERKEAK